MVYRNGVGIIFPYSIFRSSKDSVRTLRFFQCSECGGLGFMTLGVLQVWDLT